MDGVYIRKGQTMGILYAFSRLFRAILTFCNISAKFAYTRKCQPKDFFLWRFLFVNLSEDLVREMSV